MPTVRGTLENRHKALTVNCSVYHWTRVMSEDLTKNMHNAQEKEAQMLLWASTTEFTWNVQDCVTEELTISTQPQRLFTTWRDTCTTTCQHYSFYSVSVQISLGNHFHHEDSTHTRTPRHLKLPGVTSAHIVTCTLSCHFTVTAFHPKNTWMLWWLRLPFFKWQYLLSPFIAPEFV